MWYRQKTIFLKKFGKQKKKTQNRVVLSLNSGAVTRIRTGDLILTKDALYLLSYNSISDSLNIITKEDGTVNYFFIFSRLFSKRVCK